MTISTYNASAGEAVATPRSADAATETARPEQAARQTAHTEPVRTLWSRFIILALCLAMVLSTLAYGTVHPWSLAFFQAGAAIIVVLWCIDAWRSQTLRISRNALQWPLAGLFLYGLVQLLPLGSAGAAGNALSVAPVKSLSLDPYSTQLALVQVLALLIYFAATLAFTDSPRRLRLLVRTITIFGFLLAIFALIQYFSDPSKIYWVREPTQSTPFGPFINRHHFAGYMEMTLALPLGLLFSGAIEAEKRALYIFAIAVMGIALIMTQSRGGLIALAASIFFLVVIAGASRRHRSSHERSVEEVAEEKRVLVRRALVRAGIGLALMVTLLIGVVWLGGEAGLSRFVGTVNSEDPTTGRAHFWNVTLDIIRAHPILGAGLGAYSLAYTRYDSNNGLFRVEQAHNDYLQVLADTGIIGAVLGVFFLVALFRLGFARRESEDVFRRGVAIGALAGCFAVLVHSLFDFTLHTTSNALLFLIMTALATLNGRVEEASSSGGRRRRRRHQQSRRASSSERSGSDYAAGTSTPHTATTPPPKT